MGGVAWAATLILPLRAAKRLQKIGTKDFIERVGKDFAGDADPAVESVEPAERAGMSEQIRSKANEICFLFRQVEEKMSRSGEWFDSRVADRAQGKHRHIVPRTNLGDRFRFHVDGCGARSFVQRFPLLHR